MSTVDNKTIGGKPKPKFAPKIPPKHGDSINKANDQQQSADIDSQGGSQVSMSSKDHIAIKMEPVGGKKQSSKPFFVKSENNRRFMVPSGQTFFTGTSSIAPNTTAQAKPVERSSRIPAPKPTSIGGGYGVDVPIKDDPDKHGEILIDSDDEDFSQQKQIDYKISNAEAWPPASHIMSSPVRLPFGPTSHSKRMEISNKEIFETDIANISKMTKEIDEKMLLLQLPSALQKYVNLMQIEHDPKSKNENFTENDTNSKFGCNYNAKLGLVGKIQLLKSGKIILLLSDSLAAEKYFEMHPGIDTFFSQAIVRIAEGTQDAAQAHNGGHMCYLGNVTRKVVVTPSLQ